MVNFDDLDFDDIYVKLSQSKTGFLYLDNNKISYEKGVPILHISDFEDEYEIDADYLLSVVNLNYFNYIENINKKTMKQNQ
jgi:hypothetical protein